MLFVISPSKTLDFETSPPTKTHTIPDFLEDSQKLINKLSGLSEKKLSQLMHISPKLAQLNAQRYNDWQAPFNLKNAKQAALAFKGDVYTGLQADTFSIHDLKFAQKHLRILSGLYGILRPLDLMQPYRLEMGTELSTNRKKDLYAFWDKKIAETINEELKKLKSDILVNLASQEYFKAVHPKTLQAQIITPVFKDFKNGKYKFITFYAKKARGSMVHYAVKNRIKKVEGLKGFDLDGYAYNEGMSSEKEWVFTRKQ